MTTLHDTMQQIGRQARQASRVMMRATGAQKAEALLAMAEALSAQRSALQRANASDVDAARARQLEPALLDRLTLSELSIDVMFAGLRQIAAMPVPIGGLSATTERPNGLQVVQMRVQLGAFGLI